MDSLRSMEANGIITRTVYPEVPPRVEYALSDSGESMRPNIKSMKRGDWIIKIEEIKSSKTVELLWQACCFLLFISFRSAAMPP